MQSLQCIYILSYTVPPRRSIWSKIAINPSETFGNASNRYYHPISSHRVQRERQSGYASSVASYLHSSAYEPFSAEANRTTNLEISDSQDFNFLWYRNYYVPMLYEMWVTSKKAVGLRLLAKIRILYSLNLYILKYHTHKHTFMRILEFLEFFEYLKNQVSCYFLIRES